MTQIGKALPCLICGDRQETLMGQAVGNQAEINCNSRLELYLRVGLPVAAGNLWFGVPASAGGGVVFPSVSVES